MPDVFGGGDEEARGTEAEVSRYDWRTAGTRLARYSEANAATHDRAADLFEGMRGRQPDEGKRAALEQSIAEHRRAAEALRSVERLAERALAQYEARVVGEVPAGDRDGQLTKVAALARLRELVDDQIERAVVTARDAGATWEQLGTALGVTRQTAHERYRRRRGRSSR